MDLLSEKLDRWEQDLASAHGPNVELARNDAQKSGHVAEGIWVKVAKDILPPNYRVLTRKYMGTEVDVVILPPSAPSFYDDAAVTDIPAGVASAVIHVKNTLNKEELRDAMKRVSTANSDQPIYRPTPERERLGLPSAVVALGSSWTGGFDSFLGAFDNLVSEEIEVNHPSQVPGFIGTPQWHLNSSSLDMPYMRSVAPDARLPSYQAVGDPRWQKPHVVLTIMRTPTGKPIHAFAQWLYTVCAASDPTLESMRVALVQLFQLQSSGQMVPFEAKNVYSESTLRKLRIG